MPVTEESSPDDSGTEEASPHLEVVAQDEPQQEGQAEESTADISDKVDRLLEELREVT